MQKLGEKIGQAAFGQAVGWIIRQAWTWALASGLLGAILAFIQQLPLLYIFLAALVAAGLVMWMLAQSSIRRTLSSPRDKIVVEAMNPIHFPVGDRQHIRPQIIIRNLANFPIEVDVEETGWAMDDMTGKQRTDLQTTAIVSPAGNQVLRGPTFDRDLPKTPDGKFLGSAADIKVHLQIRYGRPGTLRYLHSQQYALKCWLDPENVQTSVSMEQIGRGQFS